MIAGIRGVALASAYEPAIRHLAYIIAQAEAGPHHPNPTHYACAHVDRHIRAARDVFLAITDPFSDDGYKFRCDTQAAVIDRKGGRRFFTNQKRSPAPLDKATGPEGIPIALRGARD